MGPTAQKQVSFIGSVALTFFLTYQIIVSLAELKSTYVPEIYLVRTAVALVWFIIPIFGGWFCFKLPGGIIFSGLAIGLMIFTAIVAATPVFLWISLPFFALLIFLYRLDDRYENEIASISVNREMYQNEKNDLQVAYKSKGEAISMLFEKYSTYYNMRKLAEELAASLSVDELSQMAARRSLDFILRGETAVVSIIHPDVQSLPVIAFREPVSQPQPHLSRKPFQSDSFDYWVIKNHRRLIVSDTMQDYRFDPKEAEKRPDIRSLIISPLIQDNHFLGLLRIQSAKPELFSNDDLRLLDNISVLASAAISNAVLYEQTKELAIRDYLTGLYVRRYFFDRLREEHRRSLLMNRPVSVLMCDLDHFKQCNDRYGHGIGDQMLIHFATILKSLDNAVVARYGGEEFSVLLTECSKKQAFEIANKIRESLKTAPFIHRREKIFSTVSIGVSNLPEDTLDQDMLMQLADQALYEAKRNGRDRVC